MTSGGAGFCGHACALAPDDITGRAQPEVNIGIQAVQLLDNQQDELKLTALGVGSTAQQGALCGRASYVRPALRSVDLRVGLLHNPS